MLLELKVTSGVLNGSSSSELSWLSWLSWFIAIILAAVWELFRVKVFFFLNFEGSSDMLVVVVIVDGVFC